MRRTLSRRRVDPREVEAVWQLLLQPDPAGVLTEVTRAEVEAVTAYLHVRVAGIWLPSEDWGLLARGHPAARAVFVHERAEIRAYRALGIRRPLRVKRPGESYHRAHALATWHEALYWAAWTEAEGESTPAAAFFRTNPLRLQAPERLERDKILLARVWGVEVGDASSLELERARRFYVVKGLTRAGMEQWRRASGSGP